MEIQELTYCCSAIWVYAAQSGAVYDRDTGIYLYKTVEDAERELKGIDERTKRLSYTQKAFKLLALSDRQLEDKKLLQAMSNVGYVPIASGIGAHDTPVYLFCKFHEQLPLPDWPKKEEAVKQKTENKVYVSPKPPKPKEAKFL